MENEFNAIFNCFISVSTCFVLSMVYIGSLYIWNSQLDRNHPTAIKRRFFSVFIMTFISPVFLYAAINRTILNQTTLWAILGLRTNGLFQAFIVPLLLTMVLFLGPLYVQGASGVLKLYLEPRHWAANANNLIWLRNHFVAPLSEEFTFRSCMLPLLLQCFPPITAVFICPLFFGVAHFHHMIERMRNGLDFKTSLLMSCFHFTYTTIFGAYAAYLFARTGHFASTFIAHAFCNHMGVPDFQELSMYKGHKKLVIMLLFVTGLVLWCYLLNPLTEPSWYHNDIIWNGTQTKKVV